MFNIIGEPQKHVSYQMLIISFLWLGVWYKITQKKYKMTINK